MQEICKTCGATHPSNSLHLFHESRLCTSCLNVHTLVCAECGNRIWRTDNAGTEEHPLCQDCFDESFTTCTRCGALLRLSSALYRESDEDGDFPLCDSCCYAADKEKIHDYYYKPDPIFYGGGPRYMGVELEIDGGGEDNGNAASLLMLANKNRELIYCKHDGSLEDGFEIVSHPMSLDFHIQKMPWAAVMEQAVKLGYSSHKIGTCGLHVHVSRNAFGTTEREQDAVIARILYFFEKHWNELLKFSRRTQRQLDRWAARYGYKEQPMDILHHAKKGCHAGRYTCVNLTNSGTIEFRIFRGTLNYNTLIATLQLVDRISDVALFMSDDEVKAMSWSAFVSGCTAPELIRYLKERRLYVNEPVAVEEDL